MPLTQQPESTCPDALNVRGFNQADRLGGGTRSGLSRAWPNRFGTTGARTPSGAAFVPRTQIAERPASQGEYEAVLDTWQRLLADGATPVDFGGDYVIIDKQSFRPGGRAMDIGSHALRLVQSNAYGPGLKLTANNNTTTEKGALILAINYRIKPSVKIGVSCNQNFSAANDATGTAGDLEGTYQGPIIRMADNRRDFIVAYLRYYQAGSAQLVIDKHENGAVTELAVSAEIISIPQPTSSPGMHFTIWLNAVNDTVSAQFQCARTTPQTVNLSVETSALNTNQCGGAWMGWGDNGVNNSGRHVYDSIEYSRLIPPRAPVPAVSAIPAQKCEFRANDSIAGGGATNYQVLTGFSSVRLKSGSATATAGPYDNAAAPQSAHAAAIKNDADLIYGSAANDGQTETAMIVALPEGDLASLGVETFLLNNTSSGRDENGPVFHFRNTSVLRVDFTRSQSGGLDALDQTEITDLAIYQITTGAIPAAFQTLDLDSNTATATQPCIVVSTDIPLRWYLKAQTDFPSTSFKLRLEQNGVLLWESNAMTIALVDQSFVHGAHYSSNTATVIHAAGFRIIRLPTTASTPPVTAGTDVVVFTDDRVDIAEFNDAGGFAQLGPTTADGDSTITGLAGDSVEFALLNNKIYCVDGSVSRIVDPLAKTVENWVAKRGQVPARCQLAATYRGRVILARQPDNLAIWYASRVNSPLDYEFGDTDLSAKAITGTNADVGQPPEPVTCLIPFSDDYLIFGCQSSIWILEGDPGAGGSLQNVSHRTGILGARAYTFDESGNLYFMGSGGLYVMSKVDRSFKQIGLGRMPLLDHVNTDETLVQMSYDSHKRTIHIFLTPLDGITAGVHVVYQHELDAIWLDEYQPEHGPFAVCNLSGASDSDRRVLLFGNDGYGRRFDDDVDDDDGDDIQSFMRSPAFEFADGEAEAMATELEGFGYPDTAELNWYVLTGSSPAEVNEKDKAEAAATGSWFGESGGYQQPVGLRVTGGAHQVHIEAARGRWSLERVALRARATGRRRRT